MIADTALAAGALIGIRHALEADHLAAVATLVEADRRESVVGISWGVGHSIPIVAVGLLFVVAGVRLPETVTAAFEVVVGVVLVYLGARMLGRAVGVAGVRQHDHGSGPHAHLGLGGVSLGASHHHLDDESLFVGALHGFAGSGALVVALVSAAPSVGAALSFLIGFSLLSIATMGLASVAWGRTLDTSLERHLEGVAGVFGLGVGGLLLVEQVAVVL